MSQLISEIEVLSDIAKKEPQATYYCFKTDFKHKVTQLMRKTPNINGNLRRLDDAINNKLLLSFTESKLCGNDELLLLSPPTKVVAMGIHVFSEIANIEFHNSSLLRKENVSLIARQEACYGIKKETLKKLQQENQTR